jgi:hypothetical protein
MYRLLQIDRTPPWRRRLALLLIELKRRKSWNRLRAPKNGYEGVTTEYTHAQINPVLLGQTVIFCRWLIWFLGGGPQAAILGKSPFAKSAHLRASPILSA